MYFVVVLLLFGTLSTVNSETLSLSYIYTALSKPVELPGIHEFTAMGLMNNRQIDYYDSVDKKKIPKQDWMREKLPADYWEKGTQSRKSKEQWFKVNVDILMNRMRHNNTDVHILQWRHGCEIDKQPDGTLKFIKGTDQYSYDGDDFLAFDDATMQWVAPVDQALPTKRKWDGVQILNQYTKGYLEKECVDWLSKFMAYEDKEANKHSPPKVYAFAKKAKIAGLIRLTCMATGFYPKDVLMHIKKNGVQLTKQDGVQSDGVLPNDEESYQIRMSVQIPEADKETYECFVNHRTLKEPIVVKWDGKCCDCSQGTVAVIVAVVVAVVLLLAVVTSLLVLWRIGTICAGQTGALMPTGNQAPLNVTKDCASSTSSDSGQGSNERLERETMLTNGVTTDGASSTSSDSGQGSNERLESEVMLTNEATGE
ncbi:class I histocompatibility antigen, F10 alpha chain-like [Oncorhynchus keta]|uniref:class I histocompatibility antigen, F10 alpha chain-like n=1 Tax=Oncorhynchus keta TaxID=8018 RepID=UPI0015FD7D1C|nr:class I histocompatibility antigen, F10 alpha chain-like [Oncorhynchus keta]